MSLYNYREDKYGIECLALALESKSDVGFGAVLVKDRDGTIIGRGRNKRSEKFERIVIPHVDYSIHAEQLAIFSAFANGHSLDNTKVYVLGICMKGKNSGKLTVRTEKIFVCRKCPHVLVKYGIPVMIPHVNGWMEMSPEEAMQSGKLTSHRGYWKDFVHGYSK